MSAASDIGTAIRRARRSAGLTQAELAYRIGTGPRRIAAWEANENPPSPGYAALLAEELKQPAEAFLVDRPATQRSLEARLGALEDRLENLLSLVEQRLGEDSPNHP